MKILIRALALLWSMAALCAFGQPTSFPNAQQNIWLDASKLLYNTVPLQALGTNTPMPGYSLFSDGTVVYWAPDNSGVTTNSTINSLTNNNFYSSSNAYLNIVTVTNQLLFTTNAFPVAAGSTWNFSKPYQNIITNNDFIINAISGLTNYLINWSVIEWSNSDSATHFCDLSTLPWHVIGSSSTNKVYLGAGKVAILSGNVRGLASSNLVTAVQQ